MLHTEENITIHTLMAGNQLKSWLCSELQHIWSQIISCGRLQFPPCEQKVIQWNKMAARREKRSPQAQREPQTFLFYKQKIC